MDGPYEEQQTVAFVIFHLDELRIALTLSAVTRVVRAVFLTPLPEAPDGVLGMINVRGRVIPVLDLRRRFRLPPRDMTPADRFVIAHTARRAVALVADAVTGVIEYPVAAIVAANDILPGIGPVAGVVRLGGELLLIHDLDRFLSLDEEQRLDEALAGR